MKTIYFITFCIQFVPVCCYAVANYQTLSSVDVLGLKKGVVCDQNQTEKLYADAQKQYNPDQAKDFVQKTFFEQYLKLLERAKPKVSKDTPVAPSDLRELLEFNLYVLVREQDSTKRTESLKRFSENKQLGQFDELKNLVGAIVAPKEPFPFEDKIKKAHKSLEDEWQAKIKENLEAAREAVERFTSEYFLYSYATEKLRDTIVEMLINLARPYRDKKDEKQAKSFIEQARALIAHEWGSAFPVSEATKRQLEEFEKASEKKQKEKKETAEKQETEESVEQLLESAQNLELEQAIPKYQQAIQKLYPTLPQSTAQVLGIYLSLIEKLIEGKKEAEGAKTAYEALSDTAKAKANAQVDPKKAVADETKVDDEKQKIEKKLEELPKEQKKEGIDLLEKRAKEKSAAFTTAVTQAKQVTKNTELEKIMDQINTLRQFTPQASPEILLLYGKISLKLIEKKELAQAQRFVRIAQDEIKNLSLITHDSIDQDKENLFKAFESAKLALAKQAELVKIPFVPGFLYVPGILDAKGWFVKDPKENRYQVQVIQKKDSTSEYAWMQDYFDLNKKDPSQEETKTINDLIKNILSNPDHFAVYNAVLTLMGLTPGSLTNRKFYLQGLSNIIAYIKGVALLLKDPAQMQKISKLEDLVKLLKREKQITVINNPEQLSISADIKKQFKENQVFIHAFIINLGTQQPRWLTLVVNKYGKDTDLQVQYLIMDSLNHLDTINAPAIANVIKHLKEPSTPVTGMLRTPMRSGRFYFRHRRLGVNMSGV